MASWIIGYGIVQSIAPYFTGKRSGRIPGRKEVVMWGGLLAFFPVLIAVGLTQAWPASSVIVVGLLCFGVVFAVNSSLHSYLIVSFARGDGVSLDVGFYYMANAMGRLLGTLLSGWIYMTLGTSLPLHEHLVKKRHIE